MVRNSPVMVRPTWEGGLFMGRYPNYPLD